MKRITDHRIRVSHRWQGIERYTVRDLIKISRAKNNFSLSVETFMEREIHFEIELLSHRTPLVNVPTGRLHSRLKKKTRTKFDRSS